MLSAHEGIPLPGLAKRFSAPIRTAEGLRGVAPPAVKASLEKLGVRLPPIKIPGLFLESVVGGSVAQQKIFLQKFIDIRAAHVHIRPNGNHRMHMHLMKLPIGFPDIGIAG